MAKGAKRPRDTNQLAKLIVGLSVGDVEEPALLGKKADSRKGGLRGGKTRMAQLTEAQRVELAKKAAAGRWGKPNPLITKGPGKVKG